MPEAATPATTARDPGTSSDDIAAFDPFPIPFRPFFGSSGLYAWNNLRPLAPTIPPRLPIESTRPHTPVPWPAPDPGPGPGSEAWLDRFQLFWRREELRLDVDGLYSQMVVSGTLFAGLAMRIHWVASLSATAPNEWSGPIWYKDGDASALPQTDVTVVATPTLFHINQTASVTFGGGGAPSYTRAYRWVSAAFHPVEFEYDCTSDAHPVMAIDPCAHPNHPVSLACGTLSLESVYRRAGFSATKSGGDANVPLAVAGPDGLWSDSEMHDAMQTYWSRFADAPLWSLWVFWARLSDRGTSLGGIMFDDIGPNHRQGTAIFTDAFISTAPPGNADPAAWVARMRFWTAAHEMGHGFNLAHSWQKALGTQWVPLMNEPEARSFMNYPYFVANGEAAFFADFAYRFTDQELLFMRHAPARFVQMGNADWFDHHGVEQASVSVAPSLSLEVRANRDRPAFEFLEPVILELKVTNSLGRPQLVDSHVVTPQNLTVIIKKEGKPARQWTPFSRLCHEEQLTVLRPGESLYAALRLFAGVNGWDLAEPGNYEVQVVLHLESEDIVSTRLRLRVAGPQSWTEEQLATDLFNEDMGRTLIFGGTQVFDAANNVLEEVVAQLPESRVAIHARLALAAPLARRYKLLNIPDGERGMNSVAAARGSIRIRSAKVDVAASGLDEALLASPDRAAETLGHVTYKRQVDRMTAFLAKEGDNAAAAAGQRAMHNVLSRRKVLASVLSEVGETEREYRDAAGQRGRRARGRTSTETPTSGRTSTSGKRESRER